MQRRQQDMKRRAAQWPRGVFHAFVQQRWKCLDVDPSGRRFSVEGFAMTRGQQGFGNTAVLVQPVALVALIAR
ncbi:hypothetical protein D3C78_1509660 [compost metagenome]